MPAQRIRPGYYLYRGYRLNRIERPEFCGGNYWLISNWDGSHTLPRGYTLRGAKEIVDCYLENP